MRFSRDVLFRALGCVLFLSAVLAPIGTSNADEITDSIAEAQKAYEAGDLKAAKMSLDYASQLMVQQTQKALMAFLPQPLAGWTAESATGEANAGLAMFGGGMQASRSYNSASESLKIDIIGDSPLMAQMLPLLSNPQMAAMMGKMTRLHGQFALEKEDGDLMFAVVNRFLITISGSADMATKRAFAEAIDVKSLEKL